MIAVALRRLARGAGLIGVMALLGGSSLPSSSPAEAVAQECQRWVRWRAATPERLALPRPVRGVYYFQPYAGFQNFWIDLDFDQADRDFARIRADGFNTVLLLVPWGGFQTRVSPIEYDESAFAKLDRILALAEARALWVILRVGSHERLPEGAAGVPFNAAGVLTRHSDLVAYLDFLTEVSRRTAGSPRLLLQFWSWEDIYAFPHHVMRTRPTRVEFARWLRLRRTLANWNRRWGEANRSWDEIALPDYDAKLRAKPTKFLDYWSFHDEVLIRGRALPCFLKALKTGNPSAIVSVQPRLDGDDDFLHDGTFRLPPGYPLVVSWFSPYMGQAVNPTKLEMEAEDLIVALRRVLDRLEEWSGVPVFLDQFFFRQFNASASLPRLRGEAEEVRFVRQALPLLCASPRVVGYALWTWRDYVLNILDNPGFESGFEGWTVVGAPRISGVAFRGTAAAVLDPANYLVVQRATDEFHSYTLAGFAATDGASGLEIQWEWIAGDLDLVSVERHRIPLIAGGYRAFQRSYVAPEAGVLARITLKPLEGALRLDEVQLYEQADTTGLYSLADAPRPLRDVFAAIHRHECQDGSAPVAPASR